jgi:hypothetical protein
MLVIPGGALVYDFLSLPFFEDSWQGGVGGNSGNIAKSPLAIVAYFVWLFVATFFLAPYLAKKLIGLRYPFEKHPSLPIRKRIKTLFTDVWGFLRDISQFFTTIILSFWVAFLLPWGLIVAIAFGGWSYFFPLLIVNLLVAYKFNKARKVRGVEAYDDKHFTSYEKSLDAYIELVKRSKELEKGHESQSHI